jgi:hypothetical protein
MHKAALVQDIQDVSSDIVTTEFFNFLDVNTFYEKIYVAFT